MEFLKHCAGVSLPPLQQRKNGASRIPVSEGEVHHPWKGLPPASKDATDPDNPCEVRRCDWSLMNPTQGLDDGKLGTGCSVDRLPH